MVLKALKIRANVLSLTHLCPLVHIFKLLIRRVYVQKIIIICQVVFFHGHKWVKGHVVQSDLHAVYCFENFGWLE